MRSIAPFFPSRTVTAFRRVRSSFAAFMVLVLATALVAQVNPTVAVAPLTDQQIVAAYEDLLGREPSSRELRGWRDRGEDMTVEELRSELRNSREYRRLTPEQIVTRAYRDLLGREPDPEGMRNYRRRIVDHGWTAGRVRAAIRASDEYRMREADIIIDRAFDDLLERTPTEAERAEYRRRLLGDGSEDGIRRNLKKTHEYKFTLTRAKITAAYQEILGREPDAQGLEHYRKRMIDDGWSIERVREALRRSPEYRNKNGGRPK